MRAYPTSVSGCPVSRLTNVLPFPSFPLSMMGAVQHVTRGPAYVSKRPYPPGLHAPYQNGKGKKTCPRLLDWRMRKMPLMRTFSLNIIIIITTGNLGCYFQYVYFAILPCQTFYGISTVEKRLATAEPSKCGLCEHFS